MSNEKPTYGILICAGTMIRPGGIDGEEPKVGPPRKWKYMGINIADGKILFQNNLDDMTQEICEYIGLIHGLMYIRKNRSSLVVYSINEKVLTLVQEKRCAAYDPVRNMGCKEFIERAHKWIVFGSKQYFPWKWKSEIWGKPIDMLKKETT